MNLIQLASIVLVVGLVLSPQVIALFYNGTRNAEPENEYDYR